MRVTVVGCSGSFPGATGPASCYLLEAEGFRLVIDLGNGAVGPLQRYAELDRIDAVCVSHLHSDHCIDLGAFAVARQYRPAGPLPPVPVYAPKGAADRLAPVFGLVSDELQQRFTFRELDAADMEIGPFAIRTARMNHPVETFGFRVSHAGWTMAYSADTGPTPALAELAAGVDLLLAEASFLERTAPDHAANPQEVHLSARQAAEHASRAGAGELVLTHLVAWNDPDRSLEEASTAFCGPMSAASPGRVLGPDGR